MKANENYLNVKESYLFSEIARKVNDYAEKNPDKKNESHSQRDSENFKFAEINSCRDDK